MRKQERQHHQPHLFVQRERPPAARAQEFRAPKKSQRDGHAIGAHDAQLKKQHRNESENSQRLRPWREAPQSEHEQARAAERAGQPGCVEKHQRPVFHRADERDRRGLRQVSHRRVERAPGKIGPRALVRTQAHLAAEAKLAAAGFDLCRARELARGGRKLQQAGRQFPADDASRSALREPLAFRDLVGAEEMARLIRAAKRSGHEGKRERKSENGEAGEARSHP